ncbi:TVP38/TMEM64 family protein [Haloarchaeobius sp. HME9146]|uniref:TVP38/TMEM64 family protein n=1 Tax=Haloarchaeobius sp. HME9146 TaxID=2978732 RepID=UPI0021C06A4F|nr:VTT domain-containing protein [Haloarchaeobius sp. HME9146]MCT9095882.1 VTT domain-containing protein [Haloarchaeobius sp. HME9146]
MRASRRSVLVVLALVSVAIVGRTLLKGDVSGLVAAVENDYVFLLALVLAYLVRPFLALPVSLFSLIILLRFGWLGFPIAIVGTVFTSMPPYLLAQRYEGDSAILGRFRELGSDAFGATGDLRGMIAIRLTPTPADVVSYGAGLSNVPTGSFALGTAIGITPWVLMYMVIVQSARAATGTAPVDLRLLAVFGVLAIVLVARPLAKTVRGRWNEHSNN